MHFLFPSDPLNHRAPDEMFIDQIGALKDIGFSTSVLPEGAVADGLAPRGIPRGESVAYRGWMLKPEEYGQLAMAVEAVGASCLTSAEAYRTAHYLPEWYPFIADLTPETVIVPPDSDPGEVMNSVGWGSYFVKDYVKSLKTSVGSIVRDPSEIAVVADEMRKYRGEIEGGICLRRVEAFVSETEQRYFVIHGTAYGPVSTESPPEIVEICATRIPSPFFSVDVVMRSDGHLRVVEVGDGQVSDLVGWTAERFAGIWVTSIQGEKR